VVAGLVLAGYAVVLLAAASRTTMRRDLALPHQARAAWLTEMAISAGRDSVWYTTQ
jgi:hypothetical protein